MKQILISYKNLNQTDIDIINNILDKRNYNPGLLDQFTVTIYASDIWSASDILYRKMYEDTYMRASKCSSTFWIHQSESNSTDKQSISSITITVAELLTIYYSIIMASIIPKRKPVTLDDYCDIISDFMNSATTRDRLQVYFDAIIDRLHIKKYNSIYGYSGDFLKSCKIIDTYKNGYVAQTTYDLSQCKLTTFNSIGTPEIEAVSNYIFTRLESVKNPSIVGISEEPTIFKVAIIHD